MQSNQDDSSNKLTADDHRNISIPDENTPLTQSGRKLSSPFKYCRCLPSVFRFNWLLSLAPSRSCYIYFKYNLLLAHGDSAVYLENEMCKRLDSWWASVKRNIFGLPLGFSGDADQRKLNPSRKRNVSCI